MYLHETDPGIGTPCHQCQSQDVTAVYRCSECFNAPLLCQTCIVDSHVRSPFHWIHRWTGSFFERCTLRDLGMVLYLGHHGQRCPNQVVKEGKEIDYMASTITITHTTGIQEAKILYCNCPVDGPFPQERAFQLWQAGLWPASFTRPQSAFSIGVLRHFESLTLQAKTTAYDYIGTLRRLTNNAFSHEVKVGYLSLVLILHLYLC